MRAAAACCRPPVPPRRGTLREPRPRTCSRLRPRLDADANAMRPRRETAEHPFATIKARMDTLHAAHNGRGRNQSGARRPGALTQVRSMLGVRRLMAALRTRGRRHGPAPVPYSQSALWRGQTKAGSAATSDQYAVASAVALGAVVADADRACLDELQGNLAQPNVGHALSFASSDEGRNSRYTSALHPGSLRLRCQSTSNDVSTSGA